MEIIRNRTIRPSSRKKTSVNYKINTQKVGKNDTLIVNITHESKSFLQTFRFNGKNLANSDSIHFSVSESSKSILITWLNISPESQEKHLKTSFDPISNSNTSVLILGSIPGDKSLELNQYYGHAQNRFWKMIAAVTGKPIPTSYDEKKQVLLDSHIGVWDVAHTADRKGSLDSAIRDEIPNALSEFIAAHPKLKTICFNGKTAEKLHDKYFDRLPQIRYLAMPSTSPANAGVRLEALCETWKKLLHS